MPTGNKVDLQRALRYGCAAHLMCTLGGTGLFRGVGVVPVLAGRVVQDTTWYLWCDVKWGVVPVKVGNI